MRLTKYKPSNESMFPYRLKNENLSTKLDSIHKLGQLEDIEEELGIDIITLYKAATCGICVREHNTDEQEITFENVVIDFDNHLLLFKFPREEIGKGRSFSGYGKTWALTKEELECQQ